MFPLRRERTVFCHHGPAVWQDAQMAFPLVDHRLDGENHTRLQHQPLAFAAIMQHLRLFVKAAADAVAAKFLHHRIAGVFGNLLAGIADVRAQRRDSASAPAVCFTVRPENALILPSSR